MCPTPLLVYLVLGGVEHRDSFNYPDGSEGEPAWFAEVGWEVRGGQMVAETRGRTFAILQSVPHGRKVTAEVVLTVAERKPGQWATAGLAIRRDEANYWHLALVEAPESEGRRHYVELQEMLDGHWLAQVDRAKLSATSNVGTDFAWQYNRPYRLRIVLTPEGIEGAVSELDGTVRSRRGYQFDNQAVTSGQPALDNDGFVSRFDDVAVTVGEPVDPPPKPVPTIKPYVLQGFDAIRGKATGFFHPEQINGTWWLIDPTGRGFYMIGTDHISYHVHWCEKLGYAPYHRNMQAKYGTEAAWADAVARQLERWGFNTLPANHSPLLRYRRFAHILWLGWGSGFSSVEDIVPKTTWTGLPNVFSPQWAKYCDKLARLHCAPNRNDPWGIGYFIDNELEWYGKIHRPWGVFVEAWKKPATHSAKQAWVKFVREQGGDIERFNRCWGTRLASFDDLLGNTAPGTPQSDAAHEMAHRFLRLVAEQYFRIAAEAIRRHDPNHLILGCRFAGDAPDIWDIAGTYCDIVSLNTYPRIDVDRGIPPSLVEFLRERHAKCGRPMMITEWSFPALDAGLPCQHGAGMRVDTQVQKTRCFEFYQTLLFSLPFMVGSNYFMWVDEPAEGIHHAFPEDSNYGLVNVLGEPYKLLTEACARLNLRVYELHRAGRVETASPPKPAGWVTAEPKRSSATQSGSVELSVGAMRMELPHTGRACRITLGDHLLGTFTGLIHQQAGQDFWVVSDQAALVGLSHADGVVVADLMLRFGIPEGSGPRTDDKSRGSDQGGPASRRYRAGWRLRIPTGQVRTPFFASECLWVENTDSHPWDLAEVFHWVDPSVGGSPTDDQPDGPDVPNYYLPAAGWADRKVGLGIGATYLPDSAYTCRYWRDPAGGIHSDLCLSVHRRLGPGELYSVSAPPVFVFAYQAKEPGALASSAREVMQGAFAE